LAIIGEDVSNNFIVLNFYALAGSRITTATENDRTIICRRTG